jgi:hypothetical protein
MNQGLAAVGVELGWPTDPQRLLLEGGRGRLCFRPLDTLPAAGCLAYRVIQLDTPTARLSTQAR